MHWWWSFGIEGRGDAEQSCFTNCTQLRRATTNATDQSKLCCQAPPLFPTPPPASERFTTNHRPPQNPPLQTCNASQHHRHRHLRLPPERSDDLSTHSLFLRQENRLYPLPLSFMAPNRRPTKKPHFSGALDQNPQDTLVNRVLGEPRSAFLYVLETRAVSLELLQFADTWHIPRPRPPRAIFCSPRILRFFLVVFPHIYPICTFPGLRERSHPLASQRTNLVGGAVRCIATILLVAKVLEGHNRELYSPRQPLLPTYDDERRERPPLHIPSTQLLAASISLDSV